MRMQRVVYKLRKAVWSLLALIILNGCFLPGIQPRMSTPPVPIETLLINVTAYPSGWSQDWIITVREYNAYDLKNLNIGFLSTKTHSMISTQTVSWYGSSDPAKRAFEALSKHEKQYPQIL